MQAWWGTQAWWGMQASRGMQAWQGMVVAVSNVPCLQCCRFVLTAAVSNMSSCSPCRPVGHGQRERAGLEVWGKGRSRSHGLEAAKIEHDDLGAADMSPKASLRPTHCDYLPPWHASTRSHVCGHHLIVGLALHKL